MSKRQQDVTTKPSVQESQAARFTLSIRRDELSAELRRLPVPSIYVQDLRQELLLNYALRRGMPDATLDQMTIRFTPVYSDGYRRAPFCRGVQVHILDPRGNAYRQQFGPEIFADAASVAAQELIADGVLKSGESFRYDLAFDETASPELQSVAAGIRFANSQSETSQAFISHPLSPLVAKAQAVGAPTEEHFPVFYTAEAYEQAEWSARQGADSNPPRETGAALIGVRCSCPETGEYFVVVTHALEASDAEEKQWSLAYTGKTWRRLQTILESMRAQPETRLHGLLGQAHGHNFIPLDGAPPCEICATTEVCTRTSVFVSLDDRTWTQAVFAGAPYALCHIFGLNARREQVQGLYSLHQNRLTQRGFYIVPALDGALVG